jgi:hypothetical protein
VSRVAVIVGVVACGYLADQGLVGPWLVAMGVFVLTGVVASLTMRESPAGTISAAHTRRTFHRAVSEDVGSVGANPVLLLLCVLDGGGGLRRLPAAHLLVAAAPGGAGVGRTARLGRRGDEPRAPRRQRGPAAAPRPGARSTVLARGGVLAAAMLALAAAATLDLADGRRRGPARSRSGSPSRCSRVDERARAVRAACDAAVRALHVLHARGRVGLIAIGLVGRAAGVPAAWAVCAAVFAAIVPGYLLLERVARRVSTAATVPA